MVSAESPEKLLVGNWKETDWIYEKVERSGEAGTSVSESLKQEITSGMVIHQAENWKFYTDGTAIFQSSAKEPTLVNWTLKGRGHILILHHEDGREEHYHIRQLNSSDMELHFESDLQVKGIVKIVLKKGG